MNNLEFISIIVVCVCGFAYLVLAILWNAEEIMNLENKIFEDFMKKQEEQENKESGQDKDH